MIQYVILGKRKILWGPKLTNPIYVRIFFLLFVGCFFFKRDNFFLLLALDLPTYLFIISILFAIFFIVHRRFFHFATSLHPALFCRTPGALDHQSSSGFISLRSSLLFPPFFSLSLFSLKTQKAPVIARLFKLRVKNSGQYS